MVTVPNLFGIQNPAYRLDGPPATRFSSWHPSLELAFSVDCPFSPGSCSVRRDAIAWVAGLVIVV